MTALSPIRILHARAQARALLWQAGEMSIAELIDGLAEFADESGVTRELGGKAVMAIIMAQAKRVADCDVGTQGNDRDMAESSR